MLKKASVIGKLLPKHFILSLRVIRKDLPLKPNQKHLFYGNGDNLLFAHGTLSHSFLCEVSVSFPTQGTGQAFVPLLVAAVAHGVVEVPAGAGPTARGPGPAVPANSAVLQRSL